MTRKNIFLSMLAATAFVFAAFAAMPAQASHKVYSPIVEEGELAFEVRGHRDFDHRSAKDGADKIKTEIEYGVTDRWKTGLVGEWESENKDDARKFSATAWENIFQLFPQGQKWLDAGLYFEYEVPSDQTAADKLEFKILLEKSVSRWVHTANLILEKELGANSASGTEFGYAWRSKWRWKPKLELGLELHGSLGEISNSESLSEQTHQVGPVVYGSLPIGGGGDKIKYELGYLFGITHASPDTTLKWLVEYETHF